MLDDVTVGNSFQGLNMNSNSLWSNLRKNFRPNKKFRSLSVLHPVTSASFRIFE